MKDAVLLIDHYRNVEIRATRKPFRWGDRWVASEEGGWDSHEVANRRYRTAEKALNAARRYLDSLNV